MKRIILAAFSAMFLFTACKKNLDQIPLSNQTSDNFFLSELDFTQAVNGLYSVALKGATLSNNYGYPDRLMNLSETRSDNLYAVSQGNREWEGINGFQTTISNNLYVNEAWVNNYSAITKANTILEMLVTNGRYIQDDSVRVQIEAQTKFLRAFCYFDLVRYFGKVPIVTKTILPAEAATIGRSPVSEVYDLILSDLKFANEHLPLTYVVGTNTANVGRVTRYAAKGILALVHMTRSSPTHGIDGAQMGLSEWATAYSLLNEIASSGNYSTLAKYPEIFGFGGAENNREIVFDVQYDQTTASAAAGNFPSHLTPDNYFLLIGLTAQGSNEQRPVAYEFRAKFAPNDLRQKHGILDSFRYNNVTSYYPFYVKFVDKNRYGTRYAWGVNFPVLRYTDVLMMRAECTLHGGGGSQTDVDGIVSTVRRRAGDSVAVAGITLDQLFAERRKEFYGEGKRWFDLQRSGKILETYQAWDAVEDVQNRIDPFTYNFMLYPVPNREMNIKPGLYTQNLGYD